MLTFILTAIVVGAIIGVLARLVVPGRQNMGAALTVGIGIVGAVVGAIIGGAANFSLIVTLIVEVAVAAVLVWLIAGRSHSSSRVL
ncbi:MAG: hypothetical protein QOG52_2719 [Frankiaceae bacterium]|jgi:uncharacterized membrane protein YeaQ/YmgE (transglycosylase-associated protein family)|nr:hypothetical protein [Frankiaceae bacterium]